LIDKFYFLLTLSVSTATIERAFLAIQIFKTSLKHNRWCIYCK